MRHRHGDREVSLEAKHTFTLPDGTLNHPFEGSASGCEYVIIKRSDGGVERCGFAKEDHHAE